MELNELPGTDPTSLLRYRDGIYAVDLLACAVCQLDLFTWLAGNPSELDGICAHFGIRSRPADVMMVLCHANGLVERNGGVYSASALAREHLVSGSAWNLRPYYGSLVERPVVKDLMGVLRSGKPAGWGSYEGEDDWHRAMEKGDFAEMFTAAMDCRGVYLGQVLASMLDLDGRSHVLDIGGGSGIYACCLAAVNDSLCATVFEKPPVNGIAERMIAERGLSGRVEVVAGDMFADDYPHGADVHLLSNVLHDWDLPEVEQILAKSFGALPAGGLLVAHEAFLNEDKSGPLPVAEYSAILMAITQGRCYGCSEIREMLERIGFDGVRYFDTAGDRSAIVATKPS